jgi:hypothetical protein
MSQRNRRPIAAVLTLAGFLSVLPLAELEAAPRARLRGPDLWQRIEQRVAEMWGEVGRVWEKVGARIDDNGSRLSVNGSIIPDEAVTPAEKPSLSVR